MPEADGGVHASAEALHISLLECHPRDRCCEGQRSWRQQVKPRRRARFHLMPQSLESTTKWLVVWNGRKLAEKSGELANDVLLRHRIVPGGTTPTIPGGCHRMWRCDGSHLFARPVPSLLRRAGLPAMRFHALATRRPEDEARWRAGLRAIAKATDAALFMTFFTTVGRRPTDAGQA